MLIHYYSLHSLFLIKLQNIITDQIHFNIYTWYRIREGLILFICCLQVDGPTRGGGGV